VGCQESSSDQAQKIIDQAIEAHGLEAVHNSVIEFDFRNRHYRSTRNGGAFTYERIFSDSTGQFHDRLTNDAFTRTLNGEVVDLDEKKKNSYTNSVNSVIYFALLPYFLNDLAVQKEYLGESQIKEASYHQVKVTFQQEGGGEDFQDEFIYWFHTEKHTMDYLAYNYQTDGGGARFRVAYNSRTVEGIRFADYVNLKPKEKDNLAVETFDSLFQANELIELSRIETENIQVQLSN
jgi:hypothetical protein